MIKQINRFFSVILLGATLSGILLPSFGNLTDVIVIVSLALVIFSSFFQINLSLQSLLTDFRTSVLFIIARFVALPIVLYSMIEPFSSAAALMVLLFLLLPAAVSSPAFSVLFGGKADLSLKILLLTSFLSIITIPFIVRLLLGSAAEVPVTSLMLTLLWTIIIPFLIHLPLRKVKSVRTIMLQYNSLFTLICLCILGMTVTARNKTTILENPEMIGIYVVVSFIIYAVLYIMGFLFVPKSSTDTRKTLAVSSGANNIGLGVTLTTLFFAGQVNVFFIVAQIMWVLVLIPVRRWLLKKSG